MRNAQDARRRRAITMHGSRMFPQWERITVRGPNQGPGSLTGDGKMPVKKKTRRTPARLDRTALKKREMAIIVDLRAGELSYRAIAQKHKVSLPTVNAKARKAGISRPRGRRPAGVKAVPVTAVRKVGRPRKTATATYKARTPRRKATKRVVRATGRMTKVHPFSEAFRAIVLHYYPSLTLAKFDRLTRLIAKEMS